MTPEEIRAFADQSAPRLTPDGWTINPQHVAIESTLRSRHGHPGYIPELDGPGKYRDLGPGDVVQIGVTPDGSAWEVSEDGHVIRWIGSPPELGTVVEHPVQDTKGVSGAVLASYVPSHEWIGPELEYRKLSWERWQDGDGPDVAPEGYVPPYF